MPRLDGTGPENKGSRIGRGFGKREFSEAEPANQKLGIGMGLRRKSGGGKGMGKRLQSGLPYIKN